VEMRGLMTNSKSTHTRFRPSKKNDAQGGADTTPSASTENAWSAGPDGGR
jgi:hypothetical protein